MMTIPRYAHILVGMWAALAAAEARADGWALWADASNGVPSRTFPQLAISDDRQIFLTYLAPQPGAQGVVYRAKLDDPAPMFTPMPGFPLPTPAMGVGYANVFCMTTTALGEPVVGLSANGTSENMDPMLATWDAQAGAWLTPPIEPAAEVCRHNLYAIARAPNGDLWAGCQWHGGYRSVDDGRTFQYVDVSALVAASTPGYFPTRAGLTNDLSALYGLTIGPDGAVYYGTETGGVVYSPDGGATFLPLDSDPLDPMSPMARATNIGNVAGLGVTLDGKVLIQGIGGKDPYPPKDAINFYLLDPVARTTTVAEGFPDYFLGGQTISQIVTMPSGQLFIHTGHDRVDMTGNPTLGGIMTSTDGVHWEAFNTGIDEIFKVPNMDLWVDGNGRGVSRGFAAAGDELYTVTTTGKIFVLSTSPQSGTDTTDTASSETSSDSLTAGDPDLPTTTADATTTDTATTDAATTDPATTDPATTDAAATTAGAADDSGCGCRTPGGDRSAGLALALLALLGVARPGRRSVT